MSDEKVKSAEGPAIVRSLRQRVKNADRSFSGAAWGRIGWAEVDELLAYVGALEHFRSTHEKECPRHESIRRAEAEAQEQAAKVRAREARIAELESQLAEVRGRDEVHRDSADITLALTARIDGLEVDLAKAKEEIRIDDALLADRDRVMALFDCPAHGHCVPFAIEEVKRMRTELAAEREKGAISRKARIVCETATRWVQEKRDRAERDGSPTPWILAVEKELADDVQAYEWAVKEAPPVPAVAEEKAPGAKPRECWACAGAGGMLAMPPLEQRGLGIYCDGLIHVLCAECSGSGEKEFAVSSVAETAEKPHEKLLVDVVAECRHHADTWLRARRIYLADPSNSDAAKALERASLARELRADLYLERLLEAAEREVKRDQAERDAHAKANPPPASAPVERLTRMENAELREEQEKRLAKVVENVNRPVMPSIK